MIGLAELFIGTMHGYALDALQTHVAETFKYGVLDDIQTRLLIDRHSRESGLTTTDAVVNGQPRKLRRYVNSRLYMQVTNILREDDVDASLLPAELVGNLNAYRRLAAPAPLLRLHRAAPHGGGPARRGSRRPHCGAARQACPRSRAVRRGR